MSGFAYLGMGALCALAERANVEIVHRPIDIRKIFAAVDTVAPAVQSAARLSWRQCDMQRWAIRRQLPLTVKPRYWPINADLASRAIIAAQDAGLNGTALAQRLLEAVWARELDISAPETIVMLAEDLGMDGNMIATRAHGEAAVARYADLTTEAIAAGVIGSPTVFVGDEMFFGQDRLDFVEQAIARTMVA